MSGDNEVADQWRFESLLDYYDAARDPVSRHAERLAALGAHDHQTALTAVAVTVADQVATLPDDILTRVAVSAVDDLYRAGSGLMYWSPDAAGYVNAVWSTFLSSLSSRGYRVHYVVENIVERLGRPIELFPDLFTAAGIDYACPHVSANQLPEAIDSEVSLDGLAPFVADGRRLATKLAAASAEARRHLVYMEVVEEPVALDEAMALGDAPGTIRVLRNTAPGPDTTVQASIRPPLTN